MERILIEIRGGSIVNIIGTTEDISIEILDHDWEEGSEHFFHLVEEVKSLNEITDYIQKEISKK
jgi:hypothetical protein